VGSLLWELTAEVREYHRGFLQVEAMRGTARWTLRVASGPGTPCQVAQCHLLCMTGIKDRLAVLGAVEREKKQEFSGRV